jgi:uncharacterized surface protein with fasciclin (FAS1) repeats
MDGIIETLKKVGMTNNFLDLIMRADLEDTLNNQGPFTVFVPNDEAFDELPEEIIEVLRQGGEGLLNILNYHLVQEDLTVEDLANIPSVEAVEGEDILIETLDDTVTINDAAIIKADIPFNDGWIHIIDSVLMP